ncbi:MAG: hypothetical protein AAF533_29835 [Acidobacteriota bacterium]
MSLKRSIRRLARRFTRARLLLVTLPLAAWLLAGAAAKWKLARADTELSRHVGTRDDYRRLHARSETNASALRLERLADALEIDLVPSRATRDWTRSRRGRRWPLETALRTWLPAELGAENLTVGEVPEDLSFFLRDRRGQLDALVEHVGSSPPPRWALDPDDTSYIRYVELSGHLRLSTMLVAAALADERAGRHACARAELDAAWTLASELARSPHGLPKRYALIEMQTCLIALRKLELNEETAAWQERLREFPFTEAGSLVPLGEINGHRVFIEHGFDPFAGCGGPSAWIEWLAQPVARSSLADTFDVYRSAIEWGRRTPPELGALASDAVPSDPAPGWNPITNNMAPDVNRPLRHLRRVQLDLEMTRQVLRAKADAQRLSARITDEVTGPNPRWRWRRELSPDGALTLTWLGPPAWDGGRSFALDAALDG